MGQQTYKNQGIYVHTVDRSLIADAGKAYYKAKIDEALAGGCTHVVISFTNGDSFINSESIGSLTYTYTEARKKGGFVALAKPPPKLQDILIRTKLADQFLSYDSLDEAVQSILEKR